MNHKMLTRYLKFFKKEDFGSWTKSKEVEPGVFTFGYPEYSPWVEELMNDIYEMGKIYKVEDYNEFLRSKGINDYDDIKFSTIDAKTIVYLLFAIIREERFCDGIILTHLKDGTIEKLLKRLRRIDTTV